MTKTQSALIGLVVLAVGVGGLLAGQQLSKQPQDERSQASTPNGTARVQISPNSRILPINTSSNFTVGFNTSDVAISAIAVRLEYSYTGTTPNLTASAIQTPITTVENWSCPIKQITMENGLGIIDVGCIFTGTQGYRNTAMTDLFSFTVTAGNQPTTNPYTIVFNQEKTVITRKVDAEDIAAIPAGTARVTITGGADPTSTPSPSPTAGATPTPTPILSVTPTITLTPTATPTPGSGFSNNTQGTKRCNESCTANRECAANLACLEGYCRAPRCQSDTSCACRDASVPASGLPNSGSVSITLLILLLGGLLFVGGAGLFAYELLARRQVPPV